MRTTISPVPFLLEGDVKPHWIAERYFIQSSEGDADYQRVLDSINKLGTIGSATHYEGLVLDGVTVLRIARERGLSVEVINFEDTLQGKAAAAQGKEAMDRAAYDYAMAKNIARHHYTPGQLAMMAARVANKEEGRPRKHPSAGELISMSVAEAAKQYGVSTGLIWNAKRILREGSREDIKAANAGAPLEPIIGLIKARERARKAAERRNNRPHPETGKSVIICGDALTELRKMPDASVQLIITSPPYLGLRDYHVGGQIGLEHDPGLYIQHLVEVFREARRVVKGDGTLFIVIGDSYAGSGRGATGWNGIGNQTKRQGFDNPKGDKLYGYKRKELIPVHAMLFSALQADGWYGRQILIWEKPGCMPESVTDRFTNSHEYILFLTKSEHYYFDAEAIKEPARNRGARDRSFRRGGMTDPTLGHHGLAARLDEKNPMRNMRSVLTVPTRPYPGTHFAQFSPDLIEPFILACSRRGDVVLDMFLGSGTTAMVAKQDGRHYVGIELNPDYVKMAEHRLAGIPIVSVEAGRNIDGYQHQNAGASP